jgi:hypothetical protein
MADLLVKTKFQIFSALITAIKGLQANAESGEQALARLPRIWNGHISAQNQTKSLELVLSYIQDIILKWGT